jgi:hypothetical protein
MTFWLCSVNNPAGSLDNDDKSEMRCLIVFTNNLCWSGMRPGCADNVQNSCPLILNYASELYNAFISVTFGSVFFFLILTETNIHNMYDIQHT